jgi:hypothetical protein
MSYDIVVFLRQDSAPSLGDVRIMKPAWSIGPGLPDDVRFLDIEGVLPVETGAVVIGFEVYSACITKEDMDDYREDAVGEGIDLDKDPYWLTLNRYSHSLVLVCRGDDEVKLAKDLACSIARIANGQVFDPQESAYLLA